MKETQTLSAHQYPKPGPAGSHPQPSPRGTAAQHPNPWPKHPARLSPFSLLAARANSRSLDPALGPAPAASSARPTPQPSWLFPSAQCPLSTLPTASRSAHDVRRSLACAPTLPAQPASPRAARASPADPWAPLGSSFPSAAQQTRQHGHDPRQRFRRPSHPRRARQCALPPYK